MVDRQQVGPAEQQLLADSVRRFLQKDYDFEARKRIGNYVRAWRHVRPLLRSGRYDLVHAQFGQSGLPALPKRLPLVVTLRGSDLLGIVGPNGRYTLAGRLAQALTRLVARNADAVIAVSGAMRELTGAIADFPGERADGGESIAAPEDELASRRKHRDRKIG